MEHNDCCLRRFRHGYEPESFNLFWEMQYEGYKPNDFTLTSVLKICSSKGLLSKGEMIHGYAVKHHLDLNDFVRSGLVHMYSNCNRVSEAEKMFHGGGGGRRRCHVMWSALISGYCKNGEGIKALKCFKEMHEDGVECNQYTFPSVLTACAGILDIGFGMQVHGLVIRLGFEPNSFVESSLVNMYAKCGDLVSGSLILRTGLEDVVSWNSMIVGCVDHGFDHQAWLMFLEMHGKGMEFDDFTLPSILNCCSGMEYVGMGKGVHCLIMKMGFEGYKLVGNALIDVYGKVGDMDSAIAVATAMEKDVVSWTSLVTGYAHNELYEEAVKMFVEMKGFGVYIDGILMASVLSSCGELTRLDLGRLMHGMVCKLGFGLKMSVGNSLVSMYAKCGLLNEARRVFDETRERNVMTWTALIVGYAQNGKGKESIELYEKMVKEGVKPDYVTFIGLLFACSHSGLVKEAYEYFNSMDMKYGVKPGQDHYACMIDLLGRCGKLNEAEGLLNGMEIKPDLIVWKALLGASRVHGNVELAEKAGNAIFELSPGDATSYVMLANVYSSAGLYEKAAKIRRVMRTNGVSKEPGRSWIEMNGRIHSFMSEDRNHPNSIEIYLKIDEIVVAIKRAGFVPDMRFALQDVDDEVKEQGLAYHGEKLAVAFGLLFLPKMATIRIYKNLRVCGDCHTAMKFISRVYDREIILRDSNRFHHFKDGVCSCEDYW